jgi:hypothetical protein
MLLKAIEGGISTFNIAERRRRLTNYGEATIREFCWNNWRGDIDSVSGLHCTHNLGKANQPSAM